jgi:hypothetical protein
MCVLCMFITSVVNNLYATGFELKTREEEDTSGYCALPVLYGGFDKQALYGLFCYIIFFFFCSHRPTSNPNFYPFKIVERTSTILVPVFCRFHCVLVVALRL